MLSRSNCSPRELHTSGQCLPKRCHLRGPTRAQRSVGAAHTLLAHPTRCRHPDLQHPPYGAGGGERPDGREQQAEWAERVVRAVAQSFPEGELPDVAHAVERFISHACCVPTYIDHWDMTFWEARNLLYQAGKYFRQRGQYWEAEPLWKSDLAICERVLGPEHPSTLAASITWQYSTMTRASTSKPNSSTSERLRPRSGCWG